MRRSKIPGVKLCGWEGTTYSNTVKPLHCQQQHSMSPKSFGWQYTAAYLLSSMQLKPKENTPLLVKLKLKHNQKIIIMFHNPR